MKDTTKQILDLIKSDDFNIDKIRESAIQHSFNNTITNEIAFDEAINKLDYIENLLVDTIEKGIVDDLSQARRNSIILAVKNIKNYGNNIVAGDNQTPNIITEVESLLDLIRTLGLDFELKNLPNYQSKLKNISSLKAQCTKLISILKEAGELNKKSKEIITKTEEAEKNTNENLSKIEESLNKVQDIESNISSKNNQIETFYKEIKDKKNDVELKKVDIDKFHQEIENNSNSLKENQEKTENIINENQKLQERIQELLGKANAGRLVETFNQRKKELTRTLWLWLILSVSSLILLIWFIYEVVVKLIENDNTLEEGFLLKLVAVVPILYLVGFCTSQYNKEKRLLEEYAFKSALSLSLEAYRELVKNNKDEEKTQKFIIDSVDKIYTSPTENVFKDSKDNKKESKLLKQILDKIIKHLGSK